MRSGLTWAFLFLGLVPASQAADDFERDPIRYSDSTPENDISRLQARLDSGKVTLRHDARGYLESVLTELHIPISSQTLVFSKTSLQRQRISPRSPRALYFSDTMYIGFCQSGEVLEISAVDPKLGTIFYTLDQKESKSPKFIRQTDSCLLCHASSQTHGVPGHTLRSVFPDTKGHPILTAGTTRVDQSTPIEKRWGGWYVTGTHGKQAHLGNLIISSPTVRFPVENPDGHNVINLRKKFNSSAYLSPHSDLVALMVLEHQTEAHNYLTRANFEARQALHYEASLNKELKLPATQHWDSARSRMKSASEDLVRYFLFCDEAKPDGKLQGTSVFATEFTRRGIHDRKGRSLRQFDLQKRLFRYPLSYLIYSPSFDALPDVMRDQVLRRLHQVLSGTDKSKDFEHISPTERQAICEILLDTKTNLPEYWRKAANHAARGH